MSEIPYITHLGDELERVLATAPARARRRRLRVTWRLVPVLVILAAGAAAADTLLSDSTPTVLVADGLQCMYGTDNRTTSSLSDMEQRGRTPTQACGAAMDVAPAKLIACYDDRVGVVVYEATGHPGQCVALRLSPLPPGYRSATARVYRLQRALNRIYSRQDCITPHRLAAESQSALKRAGFVGWHPRLLLTPLPQSSGPCGVFPGFGNVLSDASAALDGRRHAVSIENGPSRSMGALMIHETVTLGPASGRRCYTLAGAQGLALRSLASTHVPARFAATREPRGEQFGAGPRDRRQARYDRGCSIVTGVTTAPDGRTMLIWLVDRHSPALPYPGPGMPPVGAYRPAG